MIEIVSEERCIRCDICIRVCPANVFEAGPDKLPAIARQDDCQTCFLCEIYCPTDALFVAPHADGPLGLKPEDVTAFGTYARALGWDKGRARGADNDPTFQIRAFL